MANGGDDLDDEERAELHRELDASFDDEAPAVWLTSPMRWPIFEPGREGQALSRRAARTRLATTSR
jgi:hypothetical protein